MEKYGKFENLLNRRSSKLREWISLATNLAIGYSLANSLQFSLGTFQTFEIVRIVWQASEKFASDRKFLSNHLCRRKVWKIRHDQFISTSTFQIFSWARMTTFETFRNFASRLLKSFESSNKSWSGEKLSNLRKVFSTEIFTRNYSTYDSIR